MEILIKKDCLIFAIQSWKISEGITMKSALIALLLVATVLFVAAEPRRRGGKGKPGRGPRPRPQQNEECPRNCSDCQQGTCLECDDDFALTRRSKKSNKTICVPCGRPLKRRDPDTFLQQCVTECPRNCSSCENGSCETCDDGFFNVETRLLKRKICVPCGPRMKKNWPEVFVRECTENGCGRGCANCTEPGLCTLCEGKLKLFSPPGTNITRCIKNCPPFFSVKKGSSPQRCEVREGRKPNKCGKTCEECTNGVCEKCFKPLLLIKLGNLSTCRKQCPFHFKKFINPKTKAEICERLNKKQRKGGKKNLSDPF